MYLAGLAGKRKSRLKGDAGTASVSGGYVPEREKGPWKRTVSEMPDGDGGIRQTVRHMIELANRDAKSPAVRKIAAGFSGTDLERIKQAFEFVVNQVPYKDDPDEYELLIAPKYSLTESTGGDCDDQMMALAALLKAMGFECKYRILAWRSQSFTHVNVICRVPSLKKWIALDPVMKLSGFGKEKRPVLREEFFRV